MTTTQTQVQTGRLQLRGEIPDWKKQLDAEGSFPRLLSRLIGQDGPSFEVLYHEKGQTVMHRPRTPTLNRLGWALIEMTDQPGLQTKCRITTRGACT